VERAKPDHDAPALLKTDVTPDDVNNINPLPDPVFSVVVFISGIHILQKYNIAGDAENYFKYIDVSAHQ
jgi:hypothetical protein